MSVMEPLKSNMTEELQLIVLEISYRL